MRIDIIALIIAFVRDSTGAWLCAGFISSIPFEMANVDTMPEQINANFKAVRNYALSCVLLTHRINIVLS